MEADDEQQQHQPMDVGDEEDVFMVEASEEKKINPRPSIFLVSPQENNEEEDGVLIEKGADGKLHRRILGIDESGKVSVPKPITVVEQPGLRAALAAKNSPSLIK